MTNAERQGEQTGAVLGEPIDVRGGDGGLAVTPEVRGHIVHDEPEDVGPVGGEGRQGEEQGEQGTHGGGKIKGSDPINRV